MDLSNYPSDRNVNSGELYYENCSFANSKEEKKKNLSSIDIKEM